MNSRRTAQQAARSHVEFKCQEVVSSVSVSSQVYGLEMLREVSLVKIISLEV